MSNLVIVAIPDENDRVWKVSSEKVPHLTLLFLGDADKVANADQITQFVEHAANTTLKRFYLPVDRRGELGDDKADVLFFKKNRWDFRALHDFRSSLLKDDNIRTAYDSAEQFEGPWKPHLTLGYPATPAKPEKDDCNFYDVSFNRVAVWFGDFEGPEFLLPDYWDDWDAYETMPLDVAMSGIQHHGADPDVTRMELGDAFLAHFGVKGMRWGVRNEDASIKVSSRTDRARVSKGTVVAILATGPAAFVVPRVRREFKEARTHNKGVKAAKKEKKADAKWEKKIYTEKSAVAVHNGMADHFNKNIDAINAKPEYKNLNLNTHPDREDGKKYTAEVNALTHASYKEAVKATFGTSPSGKKQAELGDDGVIRMVDVDKVKHAAEDDEVIGFLLKRDANGRILEMNQAEEAKTVHSAELGAEFILEHYGVKGMRWGVRNTPNALSPGGAVKTVGKGIGKGIGGVVKLGLDVQFENKATDGRARNEVINDATKVFQKEHLPAIKAKPEYQKAKKLKNRLRHPRDPATKAYRKETKETYIKQLEATANSKKNASGTRQYTIRERGVELPAQGSTKLPTSKTYWDVSTRKIEHASIKDTDDFTRLELIMDEDGFITNLKPVPIEDAMAQSAEMGASFLASMGIIGEDTIEHFGVKGMRWGVRNVPTSSAVSPLLGRNKEAPTAVAPKTTVVVPHGDKRQTKLKVEGGQNHTAHNDAVQVAEAKAKLKKSGPAALSNKELRDVATRVQLEQQVTQLTASPSRKFITGLLKNQGNQAANKVVQKKVNSKIG